MQDKLWEYVSARGMDRRRFLGLLVSGGSAAVLAACAGIDIGPEQADFTPTPDSPWFKDPGPFIRHDDKGLEARLENMQGLITPNRLFFVRNNSASMDINASDWRLSVEGDAVAEPVELTYSGRCIKTPQN